MRWVPLVFVCGCTALFGIDPLPGAGPVSGTLVHRYVNNDAAFTPRFEIAPYAAGDNPIEVRDASGALLDLHWQPEAGTFSFDADRGVTYRVLVTSAGMVTEYQTTSTQLALAATDLGHPDQTAPGAGAELDFTATAPLSGSAIVVSTTGVWSTSRQMTPAMTLAVPLSAVLPQFGQAPALPRASVNDQVHYLEYTAGYLIAGATATVDVAANAPTALVVNPDSSTQYCALFHTHHSADLARLQALHPDFTATGGTTISILAQALPAIGITADFGLGFASVPDDDVTVQYGMIPAFARMSTLAISAVAVARSTTVGTLYSFTHYYNLLTPDLTCGAPIPDGGPLAMPVRPTLARVPLTTDDLVVGVDPGSPVDLSFELDGGTASTFHYVLYRIDGTTPTPVRFFFSTTPHLLIDPMLLDPGAKYVVDISVLTGLPDALNGDFRDLVYPSARADTDTPVFSISR